MIAHPLLNTGVAGKEQPRRARESSSLDHGGGTAVGYHPVCPCCGKRDGSMRLDALHTRGGLLPNGTRTAFLERSAPPASRVVPAKTPSYGPAVALFGMGGAGASLAGWFVGPWSPHLHFLLRFCAGPVLALYCGGLAGAALFMLLKRPQMNKAVAEYMQRMRAYAAESDLQQRAFLIWNQLFYCHHDNIVFLPGTHELAPVEDTLDFCYRLAQRAQGPGSMRSSG